MWRMYSYWLVIFLLTAIALQNLSDGIAQTETNETVEETKPLPDKQPATSKKELLPDIYILEANLRRELAPVLKEIRRCYERRLPKMSLRSGQIEISLRSSTDQRVREVKIESSPFSDTFHRTCVLPHLRKAKFKEAHLSPATFRCSIVFADEKSEQTPSQ